MSNLVQQLTKLGKVRNHIRNVLDQLRLSSRVARKYTGRAQAREIKKRLEREVPAAARRKYDDYIEYQIADSGLGRGDSMDPEVYLVVKWGDPTDPFVRNVILEMRDTYHAFIRTATFKLSNNRKTWDESTQTIEANADGMVRELLAMI